MLLRKPLVLSTLCALALTTTCWNHENVRAQKPDKATVDPAVDRARNTVKMLDDIYKTTVVLITDKYVNDEDDFPAGSAAIALFEAINKKGWHQVRLLDATGEPNDDKNSPRDEFEKKAVAQLKAGQGYYEQIIQKDNKSYLRAATPIPVVMKKCIMCHANYAKAGKGEPIGAISYQLEIK